MNEPRTPKTFKDGQHLIAHNWACHDSPYHGICVRRISDETILFARSHGGTEVRTKIHRYENGDEYCCPMGRYSMAPCFSPDEVSQTP